MSIQISTTMNHKCHEIYLGDFTLLFSYETLVGFAVPGVGRVTSENVWGPTTGKHINSFPAKYERIPRDVFEVCEAALDAFFRGEIAADELRARLQTALEGAKQ